MKWTETGLGIVILLMLSVTASVGAQELSPGTWTGTMLAPGNQSVAVTYKVGTTDGVLSIVISAMGQSFPFHDVELDGDELTFWWESDSRVLCLLLRKEDRRFEGVCREETGGDGDGILTMVPPPQADRY